MTEFNYASHLYPDIESCAILKSQKETAIQKLLGQEKADSLGLAEASFEVSIYDTPQTQYFLGKFPHLSFFGKRFYELMARGMGNLDPASPLDFSEFDDDRTAIMDDWNIIRGTDPDNTEDIKLVSDHQKHLRGMWTDVTQHTIPAYMKALCTLDSEEIQRVFDTEGEQLITLERAMFSLPQIVDMPQTWERLFYQVFSYKDILSDGHLSNLANRNAIDPENRKAFANYLRTLSLPKRRKLIQAGFLDQSHVIVDVTHPGQIQDSFSRSVWPMEEYKYYFKPEDFYQYQINSHDEGVVEIKLAGAKSIFQVKPNGKFQEVSRYIPEGTPPTALSPQIGFQRNKHDDKVKPLIIPPDFLPANAPALNLGLIVLSNFSPQLRGKFPEFMKFHTVNNGKNIVKGLNAFENDAQHMQEAQLPVLAAMFGQAAMQTEIVKKMIELGN